MGLKRLASNMDAAKGFTPKGMAIRPKLKPGGVVPPQEAKGTAAKGFVATPAMNR